MKILTKHVHGMYISTYLVVVVEPAVVEPVVVVVAVNGRGEERLPADDCHGFGKGAVFSVPACGSLFGVSAAFPCLPLVVAPPNKAEKGLFWAF